MSFNSRNLVLAVLLVINFLSLSAQNKHVKPSLVLVICVDQMRGDYLDRFSPFFNGGFRFLMSQGLHYTNATLNYASTVTCLGHASLGTGTYPRTAGLNDNEWTDPVSHRSVYCAEDSSAQPVDGEGGGNSAANLLVTGLGDWLKAESPASKVLSVAGKDRAGIMMGGKHPDEVFWYDRKTGHMVTSSYYMKTLPEWVKKFNQSNWVDRNVPIAWTKLLHDSVYAECGPDDFYGETPWKGSRAFPHEFDPKKKSSEIMTSPYCDLLLLDFVRAGIESQNLGKHGSADLIFVGLSDCDYIGHAYGPHSQEIMDHLVRLDRALGSFFEWMFKRMDRSETMIVLTADHGVMPLPEYLSAYTAIRARRVLYPKYIQPKIDSIDSVLRKEFGVEGRIFQQQGFLNYSAAAASGIDSMILEERVRQELCKEDFVSDVYFRREMVKRKDDGRPYLENFQRSYANDRGEDYQVRCDENVLVSWGSTGASHGSVYRYDAHVPIVFWRNEISHRRLDREIHTVDIAPTIARMLEIPFPDTVDGTPLSEVLFE